LQGLFFFGYLAAEPSTEQDPKRMRLSRPHGLPAALEARFERAARRAADVDVELGPQESAVAGRVLTISEFALNVLERYPQRLSERLAARMPLQAVDISSQLEDLRTLLEDDAMARLRLVRAVELARIAWRQFAGLEDAETVLASLSTLADELVTAALQYATVSQTERLAPRYFGDSDPPPLLVLAMGKLGGRELNFSSDIDLVFLFPDDEENAAEVQPYYVRLAQQLIRLLDERTADGFVYRTDVRLRPFGGSGPMAIGLTAFESYLVSHGRDWERYAYVKARLLNGESYTSAVFDEVLTPYVFRRYLDFGVIDSLRQLKAAIRQEVARRDMAHNVKLGAGGIREVEFVVQSHQLVRGGREPELRSRSLLEVLPRLATERQLGAKAVAELTDAYLYLRRVENSIQAMDDQQTHLLPDAEEARARLAYALDEPDWGALMARLDGHRNAVQRAFDRVVAENDDSSEAAAFRAAWERGAFADVAIDAYGLDDNVAQRLDALRQSSVYSRMDELSRERLAAVVVQTLGRLRGESDAAALLERVLPIYEAVCRRSAYLALLAENPTALERLIVLARRSSRLCAQLAERPILLDELLDPSIFTAPATREDARALLAAQLARGRGVELEQALDIMRQAQSAAVFRTAVADTLGQLPLMQVSDRLTDTAEAVLRFALELAWSALAALHGEPQSRDPGRVCGFAIVAYGKLGGLELGYGSDLDLVFVHEGGEGLETSGPKVVDNAVFFARLAQRIIHLLSIQTIAGKLYEVDTRLRPSGNSGLLVATLESFERYQRQDAWTWEHQALLRSRAVAGDEALCAAFERVRTDVLTQAVELETLREEIVAMRAKMRENLSQATASTFDLKQDVGGLADIEFIVDFLVLVNARQQPPLVTFPDKMRQIEALAAAGIVTAAVAETLSRAYLRLRQAVHDLALDEGGRVVEADALKAEREAVVEVWKAVMS
jgi:glutamate-ammonia-ligase adenylyltransferase